MLTKDIILDSLNDDLLFKETFAHLDNRDDLIYFLALVTDFTYEYLSKVEMTVKYESVLNKSKLSDKSFRSDIIIEFDNYIINLESYSNFDLNSLNKSTSYIMRIFSTQLERGKDYSELETVIQINLIDDVHVPFSNKIASTFYLTDSKDLNYNLLADKFIVKYFRIDKARELDYNLISEEERWLKFIGAKDHQERANIAKGSDRLMRLNNWIEEYINDEKTKEIYGKWGEYIALNKGIKKGAKEGAEEKAFEIARNMLEKGMSKEEVAEITELSIQEIEALEEEK